MSNITFINTAEIYPHPDNPRRDVGDVTELADSIRAMGVLQNLTVVPGHRMTDDEWKAANDIYRESPNEDLRMQLNRKRSPDGYTVIIGHRRLAAAKLAGVNAVPCVITDMDAKTQVSTMLLENMQRADLTIPEQAAGFQMMMDLGATVQEIAEKTGFAKRTVQRRLQIAALPAEEFRKSWAAGGCTLEDYVKIAELKNAKEQKKVLEAVGTNNFGWTLSAAIREQKVKDGMQNLKPLLKAAGIPKYNGSESGPQWSGKWEKVLSVDVTKYDEDKKPEFPEDLRDVVWHEYGGTVWLLRPAKKAAAKKKSAKEKKADERRAVLKRLNVQAYESRSEFAYGFSNYRQYEAILREELLLAVIRRTNCGISYETLWRIAEQPEKKYEKPENGTLEAALKKTPAKLAALIYGMYGDDKQTCCTGYSEGANMPPYRENQKLREIYRFLERIGYTVSDEERQMLDGTHPLYS